MYSNAADSGLARVLLSFFFMADETILVIDDSDDDLALMRRLLHRNGYAVITASSGEEGLRMAIDGRPDLVMVDYRMPGIDGYEVSRRMKIDGHSPNIPVLILTGSDSSADIVRGLDSGADDFVGKSSDIEVILARLRALLRMKNHQDRIVQQSDQLRRLYEQLRVKSDEIMALNERFNRELQIARKVQEALLPPGSVKESGVEIRSCYMPSEMLSGDFYDYFTLNGSMQVFVADVSGHGLPASILTSLLKSYLKSEATKVSSPARFMTQLNRFLCSASLPAQYATGVLLEIEGRSIRFANAAHPPFLVYRSSEKRVDTVEVPGHMLGLFEEARFEDVELGFEEGDIVFAYTDGLTDRISIENEFYSTERIATILDDSAGEELSVIHDRIFEDVRTFSGSEELNDDVAFVLVRSLGES